MARITQSAGPDLNDDELYTGVLVSAKFAKSTKDGYADQVEVQWELRQGGMLKDWPSVSLGTTTNGTPSRLRQLLNALVEKPKDEELWFDPDTLEWGYDLDGEDTTPAYAVLKPGLVVSFKGENRKNAKGELRYKITGYRAPANGKLKPR